MGNTVQVVADVPEEQLGTLLHRFGLTMRVLDDGVPITGSYWGDREAGIVGNTVFVRRDTPIHSFLHEACHVICMSGDRRARLNRDAGGDDLEEAAVCYLQVMLADFIAGVGRERLMLDMDLWGYSFRLGGTRVWFEEDAEDARKFLEKQGLLSRSGELLFTLRS